MKVHIADKYHHKNQFFLEYLCKNYVTQTSFNDADFIFSAASFFPIQNYPNKKFILGPHFSVFPDRKTEKFNNKYNNAVYIQPSEPFKKVWTNGFAFNKMDIVAMPFGVDHNKFAPKPDAIRDTVIIYHKNRNPNDMSILTRFMEYKNIKYVLFDYKKKYHEKDYLNTLQKCKYGVWLGAHESQGFALQEALSCDVPLFVWNITQMKQEWSNRHKYRNVSSPVTSTPYWDKSCGMSFLDAIDLEETFDLFIEKLPEFTPRKFILENLSLDVVAEKWMEFLRSQKMPEPEVP